MQHLTTKGQCIPSPSSPFQVWRHIGSKVSNREPFKLVSNPPRLPFKVPCRRLQALTCSCYPVVVRRACHQTLHCTVHVLFTCHGASGGLHILWWQGLGGSVHILSIVGFGSARFVVFDNEGAVYSIPTRLPSNHCGFRLGLSRACHHTLQCMSCLLATVHSVVCASLQRITCVLGSQALSVWLSDVQHLTTKVECIQTPSSAFQSLRIQVGCEPGVPSNLAVCVLSTCHKASRSLHNLAAYYLCLGFRP